MAGCRIGFERDVIELHHALAVKLDDQRLPNVPLRPWWTP